ncbi:Nuclear pore complex protein Nup54 [Toxocara canis]|uniref:Nuclear pore complex protein Nup54 n=1 Tax=Toxocara canis TaxID=6265 RepID=A0A0B2V3Y4_TOXCA|nr:Nuclear pore complex protein Nup54 [Toxocara canis]
MSLFGANKSAFGATTTTTTASPFTFGSTAASTAPAPLFGTTTTSTAKPLFGSTATTSAPLFGSTSTASAFSQPGGSLFGAKPATTSGMLGMMGFGAKPGGLFGTTTAQPQPASAPTLQEVIQNSDNLVRSLTAPDLFGDERDALVGKLNQLLAACGIGNGYFKGDQQPVAYNLDGPFHRFKAVGYNRRSEYQDSDGIVSIMMSVGYDQLSSSTQRQKLIDALNVILGNNTNVRARLEAIRPMPGDTSTEVLIYVMEKGKGRVSSKELCAYLKQPTQAGQLKAQLCATEVVPRFSMDDAKLRVFLETPPAGFDAEMWKQAVKDNPDPERLVPYPIRGFEQLRKRQDLQNAEMRLVERAMDELKRRLVDVQNDITRGGSQCSVYRQRQKVLSHRLLRCLVLQALIERYSVAVDTREEQLESRLESLEASLDAPNQIKSRVSNLLSLLRDKSDALKAAGEESVVLNDEETAQIRKYLSRSQQALESIVSVVRSNTNDVNIITTHLQ